MYRKREKAYRQMDYRVASGDGRVDESMPLLTTTFSCVKMN
jgi:hypothetical protein